MVKDVRMSNEIAICDTICKNIKMRAEIEYKDKHRKCAMDTQEVRWWSLLHRTGTEVFCIGGECRDLNEPQDRRVKRPPRDAEEPAGIWGFELTHSASGSNTYRAL